MTETPNANERIFNALAEGDHFPVAFICVARYMGPTGGTVLRVLRPKGQSTDISLGLTAFGDRWFTDDADILIHEFMRSQMMQAQLDDDEDDEEDD